MTFGKLIRRSLRFHWRSHLGVMLGAAIGSAALIGALVVGDSVRESLRLQALNRLGWTQWAMPAQDRFVRTKLADELSGAFVGGAYPILHLNGVGSVGQARLSHMNIYGIDSRFWRLARDSKRLTNSVEQGVVLNVQAAERLGARIGDQILLRIDKPTTLSRDTALVSKSDNSATLRLPLVAIASDKEMGAFSLEAKQQPPSNAFILLTQLQDAVGFTNKVNLLLIGSAENTTTSQRPNEELEGQWKLVDAGVEWRLRTSTIAMTSLRIFLDPPVVQSALTLEANPEPILTYLATLLRNGTNATPYSMVTAAGAPWTPADLRDDEIVVSRWLAEDLQVKPGDAIAMSYFLPESGAKLTEATNTFHVRSIVPMEMPWADRTLMPDFPGIEKAESTSDWDAGFPLTYKVQPKDDAYWKQYRGTPKAFVTLAAGQKMWGNRFGNLTAIRFPIPTNLVGTRSTASQTSPPNGDAVERVPTHVEAFRASLEKKILAHLKPEELGLRFEPVREQALKAAEESQDFGGLFLGFSFFVIGAALLLMALLFTLGLEQRAPEIGTLLALGFTPKQVRSLLLREGVALAFLGGVIGALGGLAYAKAMLHGLTTIWRDAVGASALSFHFTAQTLIIGVFASVLVSVVTIWLTLRKFVKRPARELLVGDLECGDSSPLSAGDLSPSNAREGVAWGTRLWAVVRRTAGRGAARPTSRLSGKSGDELPHSKFVALGALVVALGLVGWALAAGDTSNAETFFSAGALVLISGLGFLSAGLTRFERGAPTPREGTTGNQPQHAELEFRAPITLAALAIRGCARRRKRSLSTVAMLACGSFLIVSIGVFRLDANRDANERSSGTGGFALIGNTTMPVVQDLNTQSGREFFALNEGELKGVDFVPFRVRAGDEASCLNLNAAQKPRLLGVKPELLEGRFEFAKLIDGEIAHKPWNALKDFYPKYGQPLASNEVAAIGDANSIQWAMHKKVGDTIDYVDERGQPFKVRIVGAVANSILQGQLIIDEAEFIKRFPSESGYRMFLVDAPSNSVAQVTATLSRALQDVGLELTPAAQRLDQFNAVQNTYLGTFQVLGGLGLLLGSVGLGIVVLRNVLERRGELAVLMALGFRKRTLQRLLLIENGALLVAGLALGVIAAAVAVAPASFSPGGQLPVASLGLTLGAVLLNGALWTGLATRFALRGDLLSALRNE